MQVPSSSTAGIEITIIHANASVGVIDRKSFNYFANALVEVYHFDWSIRKQLNGSDQTKTSQLWINAFISLHKTTWDSGLFTTLGWIRFKPFASSESAAKIETSWNRSKKWGNRIKSGKDSNDSLIQFDSYIFDCHKSWIFLFIVWISFWCQLALIV